MKKISIWILMLVFAASLAQAQDAATQQQLDKLSGQIQDLLEAQARQNQRLDAVEKQISELGDKVNAPVVKEDYANRDDLKKLAEQVQEIDRKRQDDRELIIKQIENLSKVATTVPTTTVHHSSPPKTSEDTTATAPTVPQKGYEHEIKQGDTLGLIIKAYREQGVKVKKSQIIAANPNINPDVLIPGKKLFIPDPTAK
jgi:septal ring factor EnvC (AmiA/AmiB activator)